MWRIDRSTEPGSPPGLKPSICSSTPTSKTTRNPRRAATAVVAGNEGETLWGGFPLRVTVLRSCCRYVRTGCPCPVVATLATVSREPGQALTGAAISGVTLCEGCRHRTRDRSVTIVGRVASDAFLPTRAATACLSLNPIKSISAPLTWRGQRWQLRCRRPPLSSARLRRIGGATARRPSAQERDRNQSSRARLSLHRCPRRGKDQHRENLCQSSQRSLRSDHSPRQRKRRRLGHRLRRRRRCDRDRRCQQSRHR